MKLIAVVTFAVLLSIPALAKDTKIYKHASQYQIATLDQNLRVAQVTT